MHFWWIPPFARHIPMSMQAHTQHVPSFHNPRAHIHTYICTYIHAYVHMYIYRGYYLKSTNGIVTSSLYAHVSLAANALSSILVLASRQCFCMQKQWNKIIKYHRENNNPSLSLSLQSSSVRPKQQHLRFRFAENRRLFAKEIVFAINAPFWRIGFT